MDTTFVALIPKFPEYGQRAVSHRPSESSQDRGFDQTDFRCDSPFRVAGRCQNFTRRLADICSEEVAVAWDVGDAVVQIKDGADLNELLSKHPIVMVKFYKEWCGYCKRLKPGFELAAKELQALGSTVRLAATQDDSLMDDFDAKLVPCLMLFANGQPRFRQWGWDHDDVFDFMRTFDTMVLPVGYLFRNYYCLRSLYKFGVRALLKTLKFDAEHPLQVWMPQLLAPLILLALMLLVLLARYAENLRMVPLLVHLAAQLKAEAEDGGHCMLLILAGTLVRHLTDENFTVAVVNTGDGLQPGPWLRYHPLRASGEAAVSDATTRVRFCLRACGATEETAAWSQALSAMSRALGSSATCLGAGELAMVRCATVSVARVRLHAMLRAKKIVDRNFRHVACFQRNQQEHERFGEKFRSWELDAVRQLVQRVQDECWKRESSERDARTVLPPACPIEVVSGGRPAHELLFNDFERLLEEDVEHLKGQVDPPRVSVSVPTSELPVAVRNPFEASDCCRLASHLLTLLCNQSEHMSQSALTRFALIARLLTQILPMPLPLDHPGKDTRCFWMQEMKQETKAERDKKALFLSDGEKSGMVRIRKTV
ncbi:pdi-2 [Symbiodinium sp. KB8]|nr:pdi-2 [Symbiodinium sp. KB8]